MKLTEKDIKTIKYEKRVGFFFFAFILAFGGLFDLLYMINASDKDWSLFLFINLLIIFLSFLVLNIINQNYIKDLNFGNKIIKIEKLQKKEEKIDYEVGSGSLQQRMKPIHKYIFTLNNYRYEVNQELFKKVNVGDLIEMHYAKYSETLLDIKYNPLNP